jgi:predicted Fe-S protein YdhL (DUF1289 family)
MTAAFDLPSPCISVCEIDRQTGYCRGCLRSSREIAGWRDLDHDARLALLETLRDRRREIGLPTRRATRRRALRRQRTEPETIP